MPETQAAYDAFLSAHSDRPCPLCTEPAIRTYTHWKILDDKFPYDAIARVHHMLTPVRHTDELGLTAEERTELDALKLSLAREYDQFTENAERLRSVPGHYHLHLLVLG